MFISDNIFIFFSSGMHFYSVCINLYVDICVTLIKVCAVGLTEVNWMIFD